MECDSMCHITNVEAKWPGSVHDSRIFRESNLCPLFEHGKENVDVRLTVLHKLILGLTELHFSIVQVIMTGSWLETGYACRHYFDAIDP